MEINLIRHARPQRWEGPGPADPRLSELGVAQTERLVDHLTQPAAPQCAGVYASTMTRAVQTAQPLADRAKLPLRTDADLVEYDHGMSFYVPNEEYEGDFQEYWDDLQAGWYGGRPLDTAALRDRVVRAVDRIVAAHGPDDLVAIICHGGVISSYLSWVLESRHILFFEPDYTSMSRVLVNRHGRRYLRSAAESPHLGFAEWNVAGRVV